MLNILLPAYSRSYAALDRAGLTTATDEAENQELGNLVLRERAVVWADQEGSGQSVRSDKTGEERRETGSCGVELAPVLSFSQLLYHSNSPCSKLSYWRLVSLFCYVHPCNTFLLAFTYSSSASSDLWVPSQESYNKSGNHVTCSSQTVVRLEKQTPTWFEYVNAPNYLSISSPEIIIVKAYTPPTPHTHTRLHYYSQHLIAKLTLSLNTCNIRTTYFIKQATLKMNWFVHKELEIPLICQLELLMADIRGRSLW